MHSRVRVARVKRVVYGRLERFVMCRHRSILQTARDIKPPETVFMRDERRVAGNPIKTALVSGWSKLWRLLHRKIGDVAARPFPLRSVPPNQFLALAPRFAGWAGKKRSEEHTSELQSRTVISYAVFC